MADALALPELADYARGRDALLEHIVGALDADQRVGAAWLSGSFGRSEADAWSDLDLHIAVHDDALVSFLTERPVLYARVSTPLLVQSEMMSNAMPGGHFQLVVYPGPIEVDWNIGPRSLATRWPSSQILFDRVGVPIGTALPLSGEERRAKRN